LCHKDTSQSPLNPIRIVEVRAPRRYGERGHQTKTVSFLETALIQLPLLEIWLRAVLRISRSPKGNSWGLSNGMCHLLRLLDFWQAIPNGEQVVITSQRQNLRTDRT
jgi:hypothetical protein